MENDNNLSEYKTKNNLHGFYSKRAYALAVLQAVAFPSITAFVILSAYSFYLINLLATDIHQMQTVMVNMNTNMHVNLDTFSKKLEISKKRMAEMVQSAEKINHHVHNIHGNMRDMAADVRQINTSTQNMTASVYSMQCDLSELNQNITAPIASYPRQ